MRKTLSRVFSQKTSLSAATNQSTGCATNAHSAFCTDGWHSPIFVLQNREAALIAADMQCADATLSQLAVWSSLRSGISARMRQALMRTLLDQVRWSGGRLQAEAVGSRASINACVVGQNNSNVYQESKDLTHLYRLHLRPFSLYSHLVLYISEAMVASGIRTKGFEAPACRVDPDMFSRVQWYSLDVVTALVS